MHRVLIAVGVLQAAASDTSINVVSDSDCGGTYKLEEGALNIKYHGTRLHDCTFSVEETEASRKICAYFEKMEIASCETTIKLYGYHNKDGERVDFHTFSCGKETITEYCPGFVTDLYITLKHWGPETTDEVNMKISCKDDTTYIYLTVGFVALAVVIITIPAVIILRYRYKKRKASCVYNSDNTRSQVIATLS